MVATRLESRKSLLGADPGFAEQGMHYQENYGHDQSGSAYPNDAFTQPSLAQPTYAENAHMTEDFDQGFVGREGLTPAANTHHSSTEVLKRKWPAAFMTVTGLQAIICLAFEG